jgi:hypothetical protein
LDNLPYGLSDMPATTARKLFLVFAAITFLGVTLQFLLAGLALFNGSGFDAHRGLGHGLAVPALIMLAVAWFGRLGRTPLIFGGGLFALLLVQNGLPNAPDVIASLHPLVAIAVWMGSFQAFTWARTANAAAPPHATV